MSKRRELYVLDKGGQILYYFSTKYDSKEDQSMLLTASYLTGVLQFARRASGDFISTFELGTLRIMLRVGKNLPLYYVLIAGKETKIKEKQIDQMLTAIIEAFEEICTLEKLNNWSGNIYEFEEFTPKVKKILKVK
ncbi:MAG: hypothetical protein ACTSUK_04560 [Promethearchaeota archaeon]